MTCFPEIANIGTVVRISARLQTTPAQRLEVWSTRVTRRLSRFARTMLPGGGPRRFRFCLTIRDCFFGMQETSFKSFLGVSDVWSNADAI
jgi:hypothetical protein